MTRLHRSLALVSVLALAVGCGNKNKDTQTDNPDQAVDGTGDASGGEDSAATSSRARGSTATRGSGRNTSARTVTAKKPPRAPVDPGEGGEGGEGQEMDGPNGLLAEGFAIDPAMGLPEDMSSLGEPLEAFVVPNLDFDEMDFSAGFPGSNELKENYAIRFSGSLNVVEEAEYELCLHSDDGSQLLLEGMLVVDNNGVHDGAVESCELLFLPPGEYTLEIDYMQASGPMMTMHFAWSMNGGDKVIVPTDVLFKPVSDEGSADGSGDTRG